MSYRSRPVLDRKHRPRWQDELRTQRVLVGAFAAAIAVALGLFGIVTWNLYYTNHFRQAAVVDGVTVNQNELSRRAAIIGSELQATAVDLNGLSGGARDQIIQQQLQILSEQFQALTETSTNSVVDGIFMSDQADQFGISVASEDIDAEITDRTNLAARVKLSMIAIKAVADGADPGTTPSELQFEAAEREATELLAALEAGADFATAVSEQSDDPATKATDGLIGWIEETDGQYGLYFEPTADAEAGDFVGPVRTDTGYTILRVEDRTAAGPFTLLLDTLDEAGISDAEYRAYITDELMRRAYRAYFSDEIIVSPAPQREIAQIVVAADQGVPIPKQRIRHLLAQPIPGGDDQAVATEEQWAAALARADAWVTEVSVDPEGDWFEIAKESDDPGSRNRGGDLGWSDPTSSPYVAEFGAAVATLGLGEISEPVKTAFGYHVIQITDQRTTATEFADRLVAEARADPESFGDIAKHNSEDTSSASEAGYVGWIARYEGTKVREDAVFALEGDLAVSDPVVQGTNIYIYQLLDSAEHRAIEENRLNTIRNTGFPRWLDEIKADSVIWVDPAFLGTTA
jgi:parvulin-like peptidyl-prolyl isomerase